MPRRHEPPRPGEPAPELTLPTVDGAISRLGDARGAPALVSFLRHAG